ncbi:DUF2271 domain-containing protein [Herbaspirillum chlorophenolicum]|uniref:DUF2271 domain-containing protein n=1 Tax=Herbaspirillum chlorophenolicum TaxID=211589 RepID=UPI00067CE9FE|nr:DUF2271 domain-containing protein [Herbaspirillum chlorophenolicum]
MKTAFTRERLLAIPLLLAGLGLAAGQARSAALEVEVTLPDIASAAYHPPYLAAWIERADDKQSVAGTLAVWYDTRLRDNLGKIFLKELRTWWRKAGSTLALPADGVSGPTRGAGVYLLRFSDRQELLAALPEGKYLLAVEVAREQGGRTVLHVPFAWKGTDGITDAGRQDGGAGSELATLKVTAKP